MDKKYYLFVNGKKVAVSKEIYFEYHKELNKEKYIYKRDIQHGCLFFSDLDQEGNFEAQLEDESFNVEKIVETKAMIEALNKALQELSPTERELIDFIFYKDESLREVAEKLSISHPAVIKRRDKILEKLKKLIEEF